MAQHDIVMAAAGASGPANYIEDVFSTYLYAGTSATNQIVNGIDLAGKGGMVWTKSRTQAGADPVTYDTARGAGYLLKTDQTVAQIYSAISLASFNSDGMTFGADTAQGYSNYAPYGDYASWTFRKQPKFFDVVTFTGTGASQLVSHSLGSVPGCVIYKCTSTTENWNVITRKADGSYASMYLNTTQASVYNAADAATAGITSTTFDPWSVFGTTNGRTYVAYLFAHNAGGFGLTGADNVISCGSVVSTGADVSVSLGYEPQWILMKNASNIDGWYMFDTMRGMSMTDDSYLKANSSNAEGTFGTSLINPTATGFRWSSSAFGASGETYIYIAIRRGPMKVPTSGTSVFTPVTVAASSTPSFTSNSVPDLAVVAYRPGDANYPSWSSRLTGNTFLKSSSTAVENSSYPSIWTFLGQKSFGSTFTNSIAWMLGRAPGFFDEVCYTGTGSAQTLTHNLGVVPEFMIVKSRSSALNWKTYDSTNGATKAMNLNLDSASAASSTNWNDTAPTASVFSVGTSTSVNGSGSTYVAYLFATCAGVSKVGSYTGNGNATGDTQNINCGFTSGARFVLIKCTSNVGDWIVFDTARGIVSGADPWLLLNSTAAEGSSDELVPASNGFTVRTAAGGKDINVSGRTYIYLAIA